MAANALTTPATEPTTVQPNAPTLRQYAHHAQTAGYTRIISSGRLRGMQAEM